ncbi:MAG: BACON domain-containing protein, partial [Bacteroidales bacterium]|nr:BACON domain-containing protein [Bacteroidales bacterium]
MKLRRIIAALSAGLLVLGSCNGPEPEEPVLPAALTSSVMQLEAASGSIFLSVTASKEWTISVSGGTWATVSPASGTGSRNSVILSYEANESEEERSVNVTLNANPGGSAYLTITQKGVKKVDPPAPQPSGYGYDVAAPHWLELPATKAGDGKEWF